MRSAKTYAVSAAICLATAAMMPGAHAQDDDLPDLVPLAIYSLGSLRESMPVTYHVALTNSGPVAAPASSLELLMDGDVFATAPVPALAAHEETTILVEAFAPSAGFHEMTLLLDTEDQIVEIAEWNNRMDQPIWVEEVDIRFSNFKTDRITYGPLDQPILRGTLVFDVPEEIPVKNADVSIDVRYWSGVGLLDSILNMAGCFKITLHATTDEAGQINVAIPPSLFAQCGLEPALLFGIGTYYLDAVATHGNNEAIGEGAFQIWLLY